MTDTSSPKARSQNATKPKDVLLAASDSFVWLFGNMYSIRYTIHFFFSNHLFGSVRFGSVCFAFHVSRYLLRFVLFRAASRVASRKGSGTLCESLLMVEAFRGNIVCPNKQVRIGILHDRV